MLIRPSREDEYNIMWQFSGQQRPDFADEPGPGQESVWDYPRPPAIVDCDLSVEVKSAGKVICNTTSAKRVCETASPPTFYIPPADIDFDQLVETRGESYCEWKGAARYWALRNNRNAAVGWSYPDPKPAFESIRDWLCFYPGRIECYVAGERVLPQDGGFYGGWVTDNIVGPWKGAGGTGHW